MNKKTEHKSKYEKILITVILTTILISMVGTIVFWFFAINSYWTWINLYWIWANYFSNYIPSIFVTTYGIIPLLFWGFLPIIWITVIKIGKIKIKTITSISAIIAYTILPISYWIYEQVYVVGQIWMFNQVPSPFYNTIYGKIPFLVWIIIIILWVGYMNKQKHINTRKEIIN